MLLIEIFSFKLKLIRCSMISLHFLFGFGGEFSFSESSQLILRQKITNAIQI